MRKYFSVWFSFVFLMNNAELMWLKFCISLLYELPMYFAQCTCIYVCPVCVCVYVYTIRKQNLCNFWKYSTQYLRIFNDSVMLSKKYYDVYAYVHVYFVENGKHSTCTLRHFALTTVSSTMLALLGETLSAFSPSSLIYSRVQHYERDGENTNKLVYSYVKLELCVRQWVRW